MNKMYPKNGCRFGRHTVTMVQGLQLMIKANPSHSYIWLHFTGYIANTSGNAASLG